MTAERTYAFILHSSMTCGGRIEPNLLQFSAFRVPSGCEISLSLTSARDLHRSGGGESHTGLMGIVGAAAAVQFKGDHSPP